MAYETGTATDYLDLMEKLRDFLVTNATLVADGQEYEVIAGVDTGTPVSGDYMSFKGQGLAGTDEILFTISAISSPGVNAYNLLLRGHTGYNLSLPGPTQPGSSFDVVMPLGNSPIEYWVRANGRHFTLVTKFNTRYDWMNAGFILPDHLPEDWGYPMFVGGSAWTTTLAASSDADQHRAYWNGNANSDGPDSLSTGYLFAPSNAWRPVRNTRGSLFNPTGGVIIRQWGAAAQKLQRRCIDGSPWIERAEIAVYGSGSPGLPMVESPDGGNFYGSFDDLYHTCSFGATAEQTFTVDGRNYIMFPNIARTSDLMFAAIPQD